MNQLARLYQDHFQLVDECFAPAPSPVSPHRETPGDSGQKQEGSNTGTVK